jgi:nucleoside-diphosphate-sugar epimerase
MMMQPVRFVGGIARDHFMGPIKMIASKFDFADALMRKTEVKLKSTPVPDEFKLFGRDVIYSNDKIKNVLDFSPKTNVDEGLQRTVEWLMLQGILM